MLAIAIACGTIAPAAMTLQPSAGAAGDDLASQLAALTQAYEVREEVVPRTGQLPLSLRLVLKPETAHRAPELMAVTRAALLRLGGWHGPLPRTDLTVFDLPWNSALLGASRPGAIVTAMSALPAPADRALARSVYAAVARQYWHLPPTASVARQTLGDGIAVYVAVRGIHEELAGGHAATLRVAGGFLSYSIRQLSWSLPPDDPRPPVRDFTEVDGDAPQAGTQRVALALFTLERYLGWPALQQALEVLQSRWHTSDAGPAEFAAIISEQRGADMRWFFDAALRFEARFDYAIASFSSEPRAAAAGDYETRVSVRRIGDGVFAGTVEPPGPLQTGRSLKVLTGFDDGTFMEEWWDGREAAEFVYTGQSRARLASVDPEAMLLLDDDRANNTRVLSPEFTVTGVRFTASWLVWLQDVMLWSSALL